LAERVSSGELPRWPGYRDEVAPFHSDFSRVATKLIKALRTHFVRGGEEGDTRRANGQHDHPIVGSTDDLVGSGLARSLSRPGGDTKDRPAADLEAKRLEVLAEFFPAAKLGALFDPEERRCTTI